MITILILALVSCASHSKYTMRDSAVGILQTSSEIANEAVSECGGSLTLTCKFKKNTFAIVWKDANDISPIAKCIQNDCSINPAYHGHYNISFFMRQGRFDLTVINVTMKDNGRRLVCSDGSRSDSKIITVRNYSLDLIEDRNSGTIIARSGCVSQDTEVSFKWMKIEECSSIETQFAPDVFFKNTSSCSNDSVCGNDQLIHYIEEVSSSTNENGKYQLKVIAVYGNESKAPDEIVVKYILLKEEGEKRLCHLEDRHSSGVIFIIVAASGFGFILLVIFIVYLLLNMSYEEHQQISLTVANAYSWDDIIWTSDSLFWRSGIIISESSFDDVLRALQNDNKKQYWENVRTIAEPSISEAEEREKEE